MALASNDPARLPALVLKRLFDDEKLEIQRRTMEDEFNTDPAGMIYGFFTEK